MPIKLKMISSILSAPLRLIDTENMNAEVQTTGYGGTSSAAFTNFDHGVYTVVAGDEWGALVVVHFTVAN